MGNVSTPALILGLVAAVVIGAVTGTHLAAGVPGVVADVFPGGAPGIGEYMSTHEHFLFFVLVNDSAVSLRRPVFVEQEPKLHLHGNSGTVLHKEATGVTMQFFFQHHPITLQEDCVRVVNTSHCGSLRLYRNGANVAENMFLSTEVGQGDNYIIAVNTSQEVVDRFSRKYLPKDYKPPRRYDGV